MDERVLASWPNEGGVVYVETFAPCLRDVEFLPACRVRDVALYSFYSEHLARRSLAWVRRRLPQAGLTVRRTPLRLADATDAREYHRHLRAARREAGAFLKPVGG